MLFLAESPNSCSLVPRGWLFPLAVWMEPPEDAAEEAEDTAGVARGGGQAAEQQAQVVAVGRLHGAGRVAGGGHGLLDYGGQQVEAGGGCREVGFR